MTLYACDTDSDARRVVSHALIADSFNAGFEAASQDF